MIVDNRRRHYVVARWGSPARHKRHVVLGRQSCTSLSSARLAPAVTTAGGSRAQSVQDARGYGRPPPAEAAEQRRGTERRPQMTKLRKTQVKTQVNAASARNRGSPAKIQTATPCTTCTARPARAASIADRVVLGARAGAWRPSSSHQRSGRQRASSAWPMRVVGKRDVCSQFNCLPRAASREMNHLPCGKGGRCSL